MLCRKNSGFDDRGSVPVHLNVYDLTPFNVYAYWLGLGVYHSGVQGLYFKLCYVKNLHNIFSGFFKDLILNLLDSLLFVFG